MLPDTHINLLPWREARSQRRRRRFLTLLAACVALAAGFTFLLERHFNGRLSVQAARNDALSLQTAAVDVQVAEIGRLRQRVEDIRIRTAAIAHLQATRPLLVRTFDEFVSTLPDGVYYRRLSRSGDIVTIEGMAESYARITELMRRLDASGLFHQPVLSNISAVAGAAGYDFSLSLTQKPPQGDANSEAER